MTSKPPPVPPEEVSPKGAGDEPEVPTKQGPKPDRPDNTREQGQQGNTWQNTHNVGYQQDR